MRCTGFSDYHIKEGGMSFPELQISSPLRRAHFFSLFFQLAATNAVLASQKEHVADVESRTAADLEFARRDIQKLKDRIQELTKEKVRESNNFPCAPITNSRSYFLTYRRLLNKPFKSSMLPSVKCKPPWCLPKRTVMYKSMPEESFLLLMDDNLLLLESCSSAGEMKDGRSKSCKNPSTR